jgi:hypothetical protein
MSGSSTIDEELGKLGVQVCAGPPADLRHRRFRPRTQEEEDGDGRDMHDASTERDLLSGHLRVALPVPHRQRVPEPLLHRVRESETTGSIACDLAGGHGCDRVELAHVPNGGHQQTEPRAPRGLGHSRHPDPQHVQWLCGVHHERQPVARDIVADIPGQLVRVRGTADVLEQ